MNLTIKSAVEQFMIDQDLKGNTKKTMEYYTNTLGYFVSYVGEDKQVEEIKLDDLKSYQFMMKTKPRFLNHRLKPESNKPVDSVTVQTYMRSLRAFLSWLFKEGCVSENLAEKFKLPKSAKKTVEILSDEEIKKLMGSFKPNTELGLRNLCIVALMVDCGLRRNEVIELDYDNVHLSQNIIKVLGKGQKERIVPMGLQTKRYLMKYLNGYRSLPNYNSKKLFIDKSYKPMTENAVKQLFRRLQKKTGIDRLHAHILRHTFSTKYLINGGDIFSLQMILGHTSLDMVRRYSHLASAYVVDNHRNYYPLDNIERAKYR